MSKIQAQLPNQLTSNVKLLQKAVLIHQGAALVLKRASDAGSRPEKWDLAGGNSEWPTFEQHSFGPHRQDIAREIVEETGISAETEQFKVDKLVFFDTFFDPDQQMYSIICGWKYLLPESFDRNQVTISAEHTEVQWINLTELDSFDFGGDHGKFIKTMIEQALSQKATE